MLVLIGVALLVLGGLGLVYDRFVFERTESRKIGPLSVELPVQEEVRVPRFVAWALCGAGALSVGAGLFGRRPEE